MTIIIDRLARAEPLSLDDLPSSERKNALVQEFVDNLELSLKAFKRVLKCLIKQKREMALCGKLRVKCLKKCIVVFHDGDGSSECGMLSVKSFFGLLKHARNTHMAPFVADDGKTNSTDTHKNKSKKIRKALHIQCKNRPVVAAVC